MGESAPIVLRQLTRAEVPSVWTIDRAELIDGIYALRDGALLLEPAHFDMGGWPPGEAEKYTPLLLACYDRGGVFTGAFDGEALAGVAVVDTIWRGPRRDLLQLEFLHVGRPHRGQGLGRRLFAHAPQVLYISPAYEAIWGRSCASLYERPLSFLEGVHPADRAAVTAFLERQRRGEATDEEYRVLRPDGSVRWIWDRGAPVTDPAGQVTRVARVTQDITDRKQLEAQFLQVQKLEGIGRLAGGIAHDFNNLLTAIGGYADLLWASLAHDPASRGDLEEIQQAVRRASELTRQVLAFARKQIIEPRVINLNELIADMDKLLRRVIGEDIDLITRPAANLGQVRADAGQIEQVLINLAVNARDAMPEGGKLTIETRNVYLDKAYERGHQSVIEGPYVLLAVSDTGAGMDEEARAHAFEPFFTTKPKGKGTGLGLATCYGIVKQHGGNICLYSEVGHGTSFKIYLPRVEEAAAPAPASPDAAGLPPGDEVVLLVEDEPAVRLLAARVLREQGYTVLEAGNGQEAIGIVEAWAPAAIQLLVTDVVMPQMSGKAVAEQILARYPELKVLFISGYTDSAIVHHGRLDEGVAFLHKPFTPVALSRKVREVLDS